MLISISFFKLWPTYSKAKPFYYKEIFTTSLSFLKSKVANFKAKPF